MDDPMIKLACYEPAGASLEWFQEDLLGHTLVLGGSGSGKTTRVIYPALEQLVAHSDQGRKHALLIFDTKGDGDVESLVSDACSKAGRSSDLVLINGEETCLNPLQDIEMRGFNGVEATASLLSASVPKDRNNKYWERTFEMLLRQALRLFLASNNPMSLDTFLTLAMRYLLHHQQRDPYFNGLVRKFEKREESGLDLDPLIADEVIATHHMWELLDFKTRSILQSMGASLISPLNQPLTRKYLSGNTACSIEKSIEGGKVLVVSIDAIREPEVARILGIILKAQFYTAVLERRPSPGKLQPAGLILDDWALTATGEIGTRYSDVDALSMIRSRGGYVFAAAQGLAGIDLAVGECSRRAALANFANLLFFRSRDVEVDLMAATYLGQKSERTVDISRHDRPPKTGRVDHEIRIERELRVPAVPPGALGRLATGDAYALIGPKVYNQPHCLIPTFSNQNQEPQR